MVKRKKKTIEILNEIVDSVRQSNISINQISLNIGSNWDTVSKYVDFLEGIGVVSNDGAVVSLNKEKSIKLDDDTIASVPLTNEKKDLMKYVGKEISNIWMDVKGHKPPVTWVHKATVEVAKEYPELEIPTGWYYYGKVVLYKFKPEDLDKEYLVPESIQSLNDFGERLKSIVNKLIDKNYMDLLTYQYYTYDKKEYIAKLELQRLYENDIYDYKSELSLLYYQLVYNFDLDIGDSISKEIFDYLKGIVSISVSLIANNKTKKNTFLKNQLWELFTCYWELYCTYNLYLTLDENEIGYSKSAIRPLFKERIDAYNSMCDEKIELARAFLSFQKPSAGGAS